MGKTEAFLSNTGFSGMYFSHVNLMGETKLGRTVLIYYDGKETSFEPNG
jgi:hypothetical protein